MCVAESLCADGEFGRRNCHSAGFRQSKLKKLLIFYIIMSRYVARKRSNMADFLLGLFTGAAAVYIAVAVLTANRRK